MNQKIFSKNSDESFMSEAIRLAELGKSNVAPNPKVGAVIVYNNQIIGEGYHAYYGGPHAEVVAINSVKNKEVLNQATIYVTLEPCSHHGKTPPCADLIIMHQFKRVVIGSKDSFPLVNGKGIERLKNAGIDVISGVLEEECDFMNRRFLTFHREKRPYIVLKWAETADGFIDSDRTNVHQREIHWISGPESQKLVHQWRSEEQGILVGWKTVSNDNPRLNVRLVEGKNPIRIILDSHLQAPKDSFIYDLSQPTIIYNKIKDELGKNLHFTRLKSLTFVELFDDLYKQGVLSILVEGGRNTLNQFIENNKWDEIRRFKSVRLFHQGLKAPQFELKSDHSMLVGDDKLEYFYFIK